LHKRLLALLQQYARIAFLMGKPQDLPADARQLQTATLLCMVTYIAALARSGGITNAVLSASIEIGLTGLMFYAGLSIVNRSSRFAQSFGGLCGASAFINLAAIPIFATRSEAELSFTQAFAQFFLLVWSLSLLGHVLRHTFEIGIFASIVVAFVFYLLLMIIMEALLPSMGAQTAWMPSVGAWMV
jgi:hypothetical protein